MNWISLFLKMLFTVNNIDHTLPQQELESKIHLIVEEVALTVKPFELKQVISAMLQ